MSQADDKLKLKTSLGCVLGVLKESLERKGKETPRLSLTSKLTPDVGPPDNCVPVIENAHIMLDDDKLFYAK